MKAPTPHPVTMPVGQLLNRLGSERNITFDLEQVLDAVLQHVPLVTVVDALANITKVYGHADRESGEGCRADAWLRVELALR